MDFGVWYWLAIEVGVWVWARLLSV